MKFLCLLIFFCWIYHSEQRAINDTTTDNDPTAKPVNKQSIINWSDIITKVVGGLGVGAIAGILSALLLLCRKFRKIAKLTDNLRAAYRSKYRIEKHSEDDSCCCGVCKRCENTGCCLGIVCRKCCRKHDDTSEENNSQREALTEKNDNYGCCFEHCLCHGLRGVCCNFFMKCVTPCGSSCCSDGKEKSSEIELELVKTDFRLSDQCIEITDSQMKECCVKYGKYDISCKHFLLNGSHGKSLRRDPIIYYVVLDWNDKHLKDLGVHEEWKKYYHFDIIQAPMKTEKRNPMSSKAEDYSKIIEKSSKSICLVLKNFPKNFTSDHEKLTWNYIFEFIEYHLPKGMLFYYCDSTDESSPRSNNENHITDASPDLRQTLKEYYRRTSHRNVKKPMRGTGYKEKVYVDLTIGLSCDLGEEDNSDREYFRRQRISEDKIDDKDVLKNEDKMVIVRGIAGIGKTSFVDSFVAKWCNGEHLQKIKYVFKFESRELNKRRYQNVKSWKELLQIKIKEVGNEDVDMVDIVSQKVLIVVDGFDELMNNEEIYEISRGKDTNNLLLCALYDLINPSSNIFPNKQVIMFGRPQSCDILRKAFWEVCKIKLLEITGFSTKSVQLFVNNYFTEETKATAVHQKINDFHHLSSFSRIPIFLFIICTIFESQLLLDDLNTSTKLYIAACLVYIREHTGDINGMDMKEQCLNALCECDELMKVIIGLAKFSYISLKSKKITFSEKKFQDVDFANMIIKSGIIEQIEGGEDGNVYQFKHLVLQEFLAALYIFVDNDCFNYALNAEKMQNCMPIIAGLQGILLPNSQAPNYIKTFVKKISEHSRAHIPEPIVNTYANTLTESNFLKFLTIFYEYHADAVSSNVKELIIAVLKNADIRLSFHHHLHELIFLLTNINVTSINRMYINMHDGVLSLKELELLSPYVILCETFYIYNTTLNSDGLAHLSSSISKTVNDSIKTIKTSVTQEDRISLKDRDTNPVQIEKKRCCLKTLVLSSCKLNDEHINKLKPCIRYIENLDLSRNKRLTPVSMETISITIVEAVLKKECYLKKLGFSIGNLTDEHIIKLEPCIRYVEKFNLGRNIHLKPVSMEIISNTIVEAVQKKECCLKELDFSNCKLKDEHIIKLKPCIRYIEKLNLRFNEHLTPVSMETISITIVEAVQKKECCLKELDIHGCDLKDEHFNKLTPCIRYIEKLRLSGNKRLTPVSMETISNTIVEAVQKKECCLKQLYLHFCNLTAEHVIKLKPCNEYVKITM